VFSFVVVVTAANGCCRDERRSPAEEREREDVDTMMPYSVNPLYQAERVRSDAERRQADAETGMMAADLSRFRDDVVRFVSALRPHRRQRYLAAGSAGSAEPGSGSGRAQPALQPDPATPAWPTRAA
jgi:hypothetical protein